MLGFDAFETGERLFPMSISMLAAALIGPRLAVRSGPRAVVQAGLGAMAKTWPTRFGSRAATVRVVRLDGA